MFHGHLERVRLCMSMPLHGDDEHMHTTQYDVPRRWCVAFIVHASSHSEEAVTDTPSATLGQNPDEPWDVVVIGAGVTGMFQLLVFRRAGLKVRVLEAGGGVGGTWYWNRYPGARLDSESYSYQYLFDDEFLQSASWKERFAAQPDLERYFNDFADHFDLRRDIAFDTRVESMVFDEETRTWGVHTDRGSVLHARWVVTATGILSAPIHPDIPGRDRFRGEVHHTGLWPQEGVDFTGKRVAVIGTGASGIQLIPVIAESAERLTVFQRTPNWAVPLRNEPLRDEDMAAVRSQYPDIIERTRTTFGGFLHDHPDASYHEDDEEQRLANFEAWYAGPGFSKWFGIYREIMMDADANKAFSDFVAAKIRSRVHDPAVADLLIPSDHGFGLRRVPCETNYYETYNRDDVELVSVKQSPIVEFTETGLRTADAEYDVDIVITATGFDAFTGALSRIDIRGVGGISLRDEWSKGPRTYLGLQVAGFPNLLINGGPHGKSGIGNGPRCSEPVVWWLGRLLAYMRDNGLTRIEPDEGAEKEWTAAVNASVEGSLASSVSFYDKGDNVPGKAHAYVAYAGPLPDFVRRMEDLEGSGYPGFVLS
jgi:cation diffusion facilitator CzcD-associated flavoprotein CzcO